MTKINLDELRADREARQEEGWFIEMSIMHLGSGIGALTDIDDKLVDHSAIERRIARLPDLEAAYIEAVELLTLISESERSLLPIGQVAAKTFLEKLK